VAELRKEEHRRKQVHSFAAELHQKIEVDALGVIIISRGCFERCGSNKKTPP